ncbi:hypothetical protein RBB77_06380 [Tunturibacter psychrotolerans]|uniref:Uncharacterized protein n=1 Tax=Tunturiibacter psychrotolerans TaxID=3069686 RepID=A0AAU7ZU65_9BACT
MLSGPRAPEERTAFSSQPSILKPRGENLTRIDGAVTISLLFWKALPKHAASLTKLSIFGYARLLMGFAAHRGTLPRTRPIVPVELMVVDKKI